MFEFLNKIFKKKLKVDKSDTGLEVTGADLTHMNITVGASKLSDDCWCWVYEVQRGLQDNSNAGICRYASNRQVAEFEAIYNALNNIPYFDRHIIVHTSSRELYLYLKGDVATREAFLADEWLDEEKLGSLENLTNHIIDLGFNIHVALGKSVSEKGMNKLITLDKKIRYYNGRTQEELKEVGTTDAG